MTDACAKVFVDSNYVNKPNFIILIHSGNEPPLMCEDITILNVFFYVLNCGYWPDDELKEVEDYSTVH